MRAAHVALLSGIIIIVLRVSQMTNENNIIKEIEKMEKKRTESNESPHQETGGWLHHHAKTKTLIAKRAHKVLIAFRTRFLCGPRPSRRPPPVRALGRGVSPGNLFIYSKRRHARITEYKSSLPARDFIVFASLRSGKCVIYFPKAA